MKAGAEGCSVKPVDNHSLLEKIENLLAGWGGHGSVGRERILPAHKSKSPKFNIQFQWGGIMRNLNCVLLSMLFLFVPMAALAGDLDSPAEPTEAASAMYTLEAIYNRLLDGTAGAKRPGAFTEPSGGPAPTGHTLNEVMGKAPSVDSTNGAGVADVLATKTFWGLKTGGWGLDRYDADKYIEC